MAQDIMTNKSRFKLLPRFYLVSILALITAITGMATGFSLFFRLLYVLFLTGGLAYFWTWFAIRSINIKVERLVRQGRVGETVSETVKVVNMSWLPKLAVEIEDTTNLPGYKGGMAINLRGYRHGLWNLKIKLKKRGLYSLGPIRISTNDPFGLFRNEKLIGEKDNLIVYPRAYNLTSFQIPATSLMGESSMRQRSHQLTPHASSIREHVFGDSLSRIHWKSTARLGRIMSKEFDHGRASAVRIVVDLYGKVQNGILEESTDEYAVSIAASLTKKYLDSDLPVGLSAYGQKRYFREADTGTRQYEQIMYDLATSKAEGETTLVEVLTEERYVLDHQGSLVVITPSVQIDWVEALQQFLNHGSKVTVIFIDGESFGGLHPSTDIIKALLVRGIPTNIVRREIDVASSLRNHHHSALQTPSQTHQKVDMGL